METSLETSKEKIKITNTALYGLLSNYLESGILESYSYRKEGPQYLLVELCAPVYISRDKLPEIEVNAFRQDVFLRNEDFYENIGRTWTDGECVVPSPSIERIFKDPRKSVTEFIDDELEDEKWSGTYHLHPSGIPKPSEVIVMKVGRKFCPASQGDDLAFYYFQSKVAELNPMLLQIIFADGLSWLKKNSSVDEQVLERYGIQPHILSDGSTSIVQSAYASCKRKDEKVISKFNEPIRKITDLMRGEKISSLMFGGAVTKVEDDKIKTLLLSQSNFVVDDNLDELLVEIDIDKIMGSK